MSKSDVRRNLPRTKPATRLAEVEQALRESQQLLTSITTNIAEAIFRRSLTEGLLFVNEAYVRMFGYASAEEVRQAPAEKLYAHPERRAGIVTLLERDGGFRNVEIEYRRKDGSTFWGLTSATGIHDETSGRLLYFDGAINDITERKHAEEKLQQFNRELEQRVRERTAELTEAKRELVKALAQEKELSQMKTSFVNLVSHEFRTPLSVIVSSADILENYFDRLKPEQRIGHLQDIRYSTQQMTKLMEEVLLLGKVEAGKMVFKPEPIDLAGFCQRLVDEQRSATSRKCPILLELKDLEATAHSDEALLRHIFTNLLSNAVKYSPAGSQVHFSIHREESEAVFEVRDHGIGIPAEDQKRLFQAFHRASNVGGIAGTGLGLVIVKRCVDLHGGTIAVESEPQRGTTFVVRLKVFDAGKKNGRWKSQKAGSKAAK
ncbi:MAG TPA: PAS domain-containing sensor histidine kinase [Verrucomicrobiae bacterium]|nr:PAS domain-containing sensor histidine kinase [Verrucomicrobiae bacterium]